ncbi:hypothetical protein SO802_013068 [Lithocarpus litseifolius]|uniref:TIR domain-containing protein n=1 Tax=Lithocarpus litseifolius TaxID=425828 RepID=A0AAW2D6T0_9ROSI
MAFLTNEATSSSSSSTHPWSYDVFLSFRGEDTRNNFTGHLYQALCDKGFNTFIDYNLPKGEKISTELLKTIESSMISVIVFSENYAFSIWCLDELLKILECRKKKGQLVLPFFYKVDPSEVRNQKGNFGMALAKHEENFKDNLEKVQQWRKALNEAVWASCSWCLASVWASCSCTWASCSVTLEEWFSNSEILWVVLLGNNGVEVNCEAFVALLPDGVIPNPTPRTRPGRSGPSTRAYTSSLEIPIGVNSRAEAVELLLDIESNDVRFIGICGLGGIGKTTIAKAVYNRNAHHFERSSFLENVREKSRSTNGIIQLQEALLSKILGDQNLKVDSISKGINVIKQRLCYKKVLLILDDVDKSNQIENFFGKCDWFAYGSRIIITTRDKHVLTTFEKDPLIYKVKKMDRCEAHELFGLHAFQTNKPEAAYLQLAKQIINYSNGLPLALQIIGSDLRGRSLDQWTSALKKYEKIPNKDIHEILKISYEGLDDTERDIFLDIACFFKGWDKDYVSNILDSCNLYPDFGIPRLVDKCLITVDQYGILSMHDLLQQMGWEIVRQGSQVLGKRTRLWYHEDALEVLIGNTGSDKIRGIALHSPKSITVSLEAKAFKKMKNLKFLMIDNVHICGELKYLPNGLRLLCWRDYSFPLPSTFCPQQLVALNMPNGQIRLEQLFRKGIEFKNLKYIKLSSCDSITNLLDLFIPNLEELDLTCRNLVEIHQSVGCLDKLKKLYLIDCERLQILPSRLCLKSLKYFNVKGCLRLEKLPGIQPETKCLEELVLLGTAIKDFPSPIGDLPHNLQQLATPNMPCSHIKLETLLKQGILFEDLKVINLSDCAFITSLPELYAPNLEILDLSYCHSLVEVHESIGFLSKLKAWNLRHCKKLQILPSSIMLKSLQLFDLSGCLSLEKFPDVQPGIKCLQLALSQSGIRELPSSIGYLTSLLGL